MLLLPPCVLKVLAYMGQLPAEAAPAPWLLGLSSLPLRPSEVSARTQPAVAKAFDPLSGGTLSATARATTVRES